MKRMITIAVLVVAVTSAVNACNMTWNDDNGNNGFGFYDTVTVFSDLYSVDGTTLRAGELDVTYCDEDYMAYCVDLTQTIGDCHVNEMLPTYDPYLTAAYLYETHHNSVASNTDAAALQVAIWEVLSEDFGTYGYDVTDSSSDFYVTNNANVATAANALLVGLSVPSSYSPASSTVVLTSSTNQDVMVPEPATIAILGLGGMFLMRKKRTA